MPSCGRDDDDDDDGDDKSTLGGLERRRAEEITTPEENCDEEHPLTSDARQARAPPSRTWRAKGDANRMNDCESMAHSCVKSLI